MGRKFRFLQNYSYNNVIEPSLHQIDYRINKPSAILYSTTFTEKVSWLDDWRRFFSAEQNRPTLNRLVAKIHEEGILKNADIILLSSVKVDAEQGLLFYKEKSISVRVDFCEKEYVPNPIWSTFQYL